MADDFFDYKLAVNPATGSTVPSAQAGVYDIADTSFTSPLPITDMQGIPLAHLVAGPTGVYPPFKVPSGQKRVIAVSGSMITPITSDLGSKGDKGDPGTGVSTAGSSAGQVLTSKGPGVDPEWRPAPASGISGAPSIWPSTFPPADHTQLISTLRKAGGVELATQVQSLLGAADAIAARAAIGAGTGNGTSNLTLGTGATNAMPGNKVFKSSEVTADPTGSLSGGTAQQMFEQIATALQGGGGGGGGGGALLIWRYTGGAWPAMPATKPVGYQMVQAIGPSFPQSQPSWMGFAADQVPMAYSKAAVL